jgi:hypothetical protein
MPPGPAHRLSTDPQRSAAALFSSQEHGDAAFAAIWSGPTFCKPDRLEESQMQTSDAAIVRRLSQLEQQVQQERAARLKAEQTAAGRKSLILRLQAKVAAFEAKEAEARADAS